MIEIALELCLSAGIAPTWQVIQDIMKKNMLREQLGLGLAYEHMVFSCMQYTLTEQNPPHACEHVRRKQIQGYLVYSSAWILATHTFVVSREKRSVCQTHGLATALEASTCRN